MESSPYTQETNEQIAKEARLRYVNDKTPGITRQYNNKVFCYYSPKGDKIVCEKEIERINQLAIPPAYSKVWICPYTNGHIQATGRDSRNRKQYRYHALWQKIRQENKFDAMICFGESLPLIRKHVDKQLDKSKQLDKPTIICTLLYLLDNYAIRIGNPIYAKQNKSYGLTTLRKKHLTIKNQQAAVLEFTGKNAKPWHILLKNKKVVQILRRCEEIPGYELFKYQDSNGANSISSQEVNRYLQELTGHSLTAKDFRTWAACRATLQGMLSCYEDCSEEPQQLLKDLIAEVAEVLGHTPAICQKSYVHHQLIDWWHAKRFAPWLKKYKRVLSKYDDDKQLLYWLKQLESGI